uniref:Si:dkey-8e10.3 n=1 Tax=Amphiprion percula TaxID=161767 RepID=A0A3P8TKW4_AMPPE
VFLNPIISRHLLIDELMELTAQSLGQLEIQERFDVIKEIGRGKYGKVLLVTHRFRGTPMALKVMPKASTKLQGFLREYCISLHLSRHPCIVGLFGIAFQSNEHYCFAQELVIGRDLFAVIQPKVGIPESSVKRCVLQISSALEFIHSHGLVHRDVKPENILLLDTHCCQVKLADFGLAQKRGTLIRFITGTLPYMAPELCTVALLDGQKEVTAAPLSVEPSLDTWAFGVVIFCILTGYFPWERCMDSDDFYQEFADWCRTEGRPDAEGDVPPLWKRFTPEAMEMFGKLLALDARKRCTVGEVRAYMEKDWLKQQQCHPSSNTSHYRHPHSCPDRSRQMSAFPEPGSVGSFFFPHTCSSFCFGIFFIPSHRCS